MCYLADIVLIHSFFIELLLFSFINFDLLQNSTEIDIFA